MSDLIQDAKGHVRNLRRQVATDVSAWFIDKLIGEVEALKSLANAPVAKMVVTDEMELAAYNAYKTQIIYGNGTISGLRAALEAVFSSMPVSADKPIDIEKEVHQPSYNAGWADCLESLEEEQTFDQWLKRNTEYGDTDALTDEEIGYMFREWEKLKKNLG